MNFRRLGDSQLSDFAKNVRDKLAAHEVKCLTDAQADQLAALLDSMTATFEESVLETLDIITKKKAQVTAKNEQRNELADELATVLKTIIAAAGDPADFLKCGYKPRDSRSTIVANEPSRLSATEVWNTHNKLAWHGNNPFGAVIYEISRSNETGPWSVIDVTKKKSYIDDDPAAITGTPIRYRVRAIAAKTRSVYSNTAVVYWRT